MPEFCLSAKVGAWRGTLASPVMGNERVEGGNLTWVQGNPTCLGVCVQGIRRLLDWVSIHPLRPPPAPPDPGIAGGFQQADVALLRNDRWASVCVSFYDVCPLCL